MTTANTAIADAIANLKAAADHAEDAATSCNDASCALIDALAGMVKALPPSDAHSAAAQTLGSAQKTGRKVAEHAGDAERIQHPIALLAGHLRVALGQSAPDETMAGDIITALSDAMAGKDGLVRMLSVSAYRATSVAEHLDLVLRAMSTTVDLARVQREIQQMREEDEEYES